MSITTPGESLIDKALRIAIEVYIDQQFQLFLRTLNVPQAREELLSCARMHFNGRGSVTTKPIYQDFTKDTLMTNPVIADSFGRFPKIYLDGAYSVLLCSEGGVILVGFDVDG